MVVVVDAVIRFPQVGDCSLPTAASLALCSRQTLALSDLPTTPVAVPVPENITSGLDQ